MCQSAWMLKSWVEGGDTIEDGALQIALELAATRSGGWSVWVGVFPL